MKNYPKNNHSLSQATYPHILLLPKSKKPGLIKIESGRILHKHEIETVMKLLCFGDDIFCQAESKLIKTADIVWRNEAWEIKNITGGTRNTIKNSIEKARKQSRYIILDMSDSSISLERSLGKIKTLFIYNKKIIKILIISKQKYCLLDRFMLG